MTTDTKKFLTRMVVFLVVVAVGCTFLVDTLIDIFTVNPVLNGFIFGVILTGIVLNFRQVVMLSPETRFIENLRENPTLTAATLDDERSQVSETKLRLLSPMARMLEEKRSRGRIVLNPMAMRTLLDGIAARLDEGRELSRYLTGLCIFLGLLGTFWGLLETVAAIADVIRGLSVTGEDIAVMFNTLKQGLEEPLSGMGTAFSSSLFGLAGSLVLGFLDLQAGQAQNSFYNDLEEWLSGVTRLSSGSGVGDGEQGVSAYTEALLEQTAESLNELQNIMAKGEQSRVGGNQQLASLNDKLSLLTDQMRAEQQVLLRMAEGQKDLGTLIRKVGELAENLAAPPPMAGVLDETTRNHIRNIDVALTRLVGALDTGREETVREIRNEIKLLAKTVASTAARDGAPDAG